MRLFIKLIILIVVIAVAGVISLPFIVNPNDYKDEIAAQVEKVTGRKLTLQGDIGLSVFPWVALELGPLSLSNAKGFSHESFAKVDAAEVRIKLLPLLQKHLEMDTVILDGLVLNLETNKAGKTNWADLTGSSEKEPEKQPSKDKQDAPALASISIAGVKLTNANISWADASKDENYQLHNLNLTTDPLAPGKAAAVELDFDASSAKPQAKAHVALNTQVTANIGKQQYKLDDLKLTTVAQGKGLPFSQANISVAAAINADMASQLVTVKNLLLNVKANKDQQNIDANLSTQIDSNLASQQTKLSGLKLTAKINDPSLPGKQANIKVSSQVSADMKQQTLTLSALVVELQDLLIKGNIKANKLLSANPAYVGQLHVDPFNLRQLANKLNIKLPKMADDSTLKLVELTSEFEGTTNSFNAKKLDLALDQSKLTGRFAVNSFAKPAYNFKLKLDQINADRYLPPVDKTKKAAPQPTSTAATGGSSELPLDAIRQVNAKGIIDIGKLKISNTNSENIHVEINAANGLVKLAPMSAALYQGKYNGNVVLDARSNALKLAIDEHIKGVQAQPLLKDLTGKDKLSGIANANVKLNGQGSNVDGIKKTLTGKGNFAFTGGAIKGINIAESIRKAKAALKGKIPSKSDASVQTDFSSLTGSFTVTNGIISNQDLNAMSPLLRISGAGKVDLPRQLIDYGLKVAVVKTAEGQGGKELDDLKGLTIPVKISGNFDNPKPTVDLAGLLKGKAEQELKAKASEQLKKKLGSDLGGLLGGKATTKGSETGTKSTTGNTDKKPEDKLKDKLKSLF